MSTSSAPASPMSYAARPASRLGSPNVRMWLLYFPLCFVTSTMAISTWDSRSNGATGSAASGAAMLVWLIGMVTAASLAYRRRFPIQITVATAVVALLLPLDPTPALIAFGSLTVRRFDRVTAALGGLVGLATVVSVWRDARGTSKSESFWQLFANSGVKDPQVQVEPLSWWVILAIAGVCFGLTFGVAMLLRDRVHRRDRERVETEQRVVVDTLSDELARQGERERLAQEVHDALGHRLSLLSLHAGALELAAADGDSRAAESAALVRANAQQSMADLRQLLAMLRQPHAPDVADAVPTLGDVGSLVDEALATGATLVSTVHLESVERLDPTTSRSAFRIAQELLTNARRHAPGIGVRLRVAAAPALGVEIEVANHLPAGVVGPVEAGNGLRGMRSRVEQLGGDWRWWVDEQRVFRAAARLPWAWATHVGTDAPSDAPFEEDQ